MFNVALNLCSSTFQAYCFSHCNQNNYDIASVISRIITIFVPNIRIMHLIDRNIQQIIALCKKYKVKRLYAFGSILTPKFNDQSDIDLAVDFNDQEIPDMFEHFFDFIYELETLLGRKVDLVDQSAIRNSYFQKELNSTKKLIYG